MAPWERSQLQLTVKYINNAANVGAVTQGLIAPSYCISHVASKSCSWQANSINYDLDIIDIIAVEEHRMIASLEIDTIKSDGGELTLIFATATKQKFGGIRILIRKRHSSPYLTSEKISDRIIKTYFGGHAMVTIIVT